MGSRVKLTEPSATGARLPSSKGIFKPEAPKSFFHGGPHRHPTVEQNQTKTLLRENFTANSRLSEYIEPKQNIKGRKETRANSRRLQGKFDALWHCKDFGSKGGGAAEGQEELPEVKEAGPPTKSKQAPTMKRKQSRVVFTEKEVLRNSTGKAASTVARKSPAHLGKVEPLDTTKHIEKVNQFFKAEAERKKRMEAVVLPPRRDEPELPESQFENQLQAAIETGEPVELATNTESLFIDYYIK